MTDPADPLAAYAAQATNCRWCLEGVEIVFAITRASKRIPIEYGRNNNGNVEIRPGGSPQAPPMAEVHAGPHVADLFDDGPAPARYMPHHATCDRDAPTGPAPTANPTGQA